MSTCWSDVFLAITLDPYMFLTKINAHIIWTGQTDRQTDTHTHCQTNYNYINLRVCADAWLINTESL